MFCSVVFMMVAVKPIMSWIGHSAPDNEPISKTYACITVAGVLEVGFAADVIWIHSMFRAVVKFGLTIPKDSTFARMVV
jgi:hypothetical protein